MAKSFRRILILNRGEIACRLIQACQELGVEAIAVYSDADSNARHRDLADEAVSLGASSAKESYLNLEKLVKVAQEKNCDAVHPGYGFLSERAEAAEAFEKVGICWIGPKPESIRLLGDKLEAKKLLSQYAIPTAPWGEVNANDPKALQELAQKIGYPVLLKAASGGGGKGMRLVHVPSELLESAAIASREARASFGDATLLLEKYLQEPRHIEIQIMGDNTGEVIHFGERECSLQRRHQKVIEEAPALNLKESTKSAIADAAVKLTKAVGYANAGTVEFLVDKEENFYFLEVNSRLQVEHSVTEAVWGIDLVKTQIRIAAGATLEELFPTRHAMAPRGHSMQARIYAEDSSQGFAPCPGPLTKVEWPTGVGIRIDTGVRTGSTIGLDYDAMIAKLTVYSENRKDAIARLEWCLKNTILFGTTTNINYLQDILKQKEVLLGSLHVKYLESILGTWKDPVPESLLAERQTLLREAGTNSFVSAEQTRAASPWEHL